MQSDISLEEDVNDLNHRVHQLQEQVSHLADSQATTDERYSKVKQENASLNQKILMLEEHIRELELRSEERLQTEQKRNKDSIQRLEREKQLEIENYSIKLQNLERDYNRAQQEIVQQRSVIERLRLDKAELDEQLNEAHAALSLNETEIRKLEEAAKIESERCKGETANSAQLVEELEKEVESLRDQLRNRTSAGRRQAYAGNVIDNATGHVTRLNSTDSAFSVSTEDRMVNRVMEMESEIKALKETNRKLIETNEEMHAQVLNRGLEEGKAVLFSHDTAKANLESMSIARELEGLSDSQMSYGTISDELCQVRQALKEQQDVNEGLRGYIDGILMNIMEKYPELLEVRK
jgi:chromosome segregation ATPase